MGRLISVLATVARHPKYARVTLVQRDGTGVLGRVTRPGRHLKGLEVLIIGNRQRAVSRDTVADLKDGAVAGADALQCVVVTQRIVVIDNHGAQNVDAGEGVGATQRQVTATGLEDLVGIAAIGDITVDGDIVILSTVVAAVVSVRGVNRPVPPTKLDIQVDRVVEYPWRVAIIVLICRKRTRDRACYDNVATVEGEVGLLLASTPVVGERDVIEICARGVCIGCGGLNVTQEDQIVTANRSGIVGPVEVVGPGVVGTIAIPGVGCGEKRRGQAEPENRQEGQYV